MTRFFEFVGSHPILTSLWMFLLVTLILYQKNRAGKSVTAQQAVMLVNKSDGVIVDVRDKKDFDKGHIANAVNIPLGKLSERVEELGDSREKPVIVVCQMGHQSGDAVKVLQDTGFSQVVRMVGGMAEWRAQTLPVVTK